MRTTFAAREFTDEPIDEETIARILDNARFGPSGGNRQGWKVVVVRDAAVRKRFGELIAPTLQRYLAQVQAGESPFNTVEPSKVTEAMVAQTRVPADLIDKLVNAPVLMLVGVDLRQVAAFDSHLDRVGIIAGASVYPFIWNILLAARNEGLGGTLTTFLCAAEREVQQLLGFPPQVALAAMLPMGKPKKQLKRLRRRKVDAFAWFDRFEGEAINARRSGT